MKKWVCVILATVMIGLCCVCFSGCRQSTIVSYNVSKEADSFNVVRRITVINCRTNTVLYEMTGVISIRTDSDGDLNVIVDKGDGTYQKHFIHLNEWTTYTVEDLGCSDVSKYQFEFNILPEYFPGFTVTSDE